MSEFSEFASTNDPTAPVILWLMLVAFFLMGMLAGAGITHFYIGRQRDGALNTTYRSIYEDPDAHTKPTSRKGRDI